MADYIDLYKLFGTETELRNRVVLATEVKAYELATDPSATTAQKKFLSDVTKSPSSYGIRVWQLVLVANKDLTLSQILGADDTAIQVAVDVIVPVLIDAESA